MNEINSNNKQANDTLHQQQQQHHLSPNVCSQLISKVNHNDDDSSLASSISSSSCLTNSHQQNKSLSSSSFLLTSSQVHDSSALNLKEILQLFNCAISQEQAWAVLYQTLNGLKYLFKNNLNLIKSNVDNIAIHLLYLNKDGSVLFCFNTDEGGGGGSGGVLVSMSDVSLGELVTYFKKRLVSSSP